jgi:DNA-binding NtrC family response regulator
MDCIARYLPMAKSRIEKDTKIITAYENRKKIILVIDDDKDTSASLKIVLEESGKFEVNSFDDPSQALASFKSNGYDAVIVDVKMPEMNGLNYIEN